MFAGNHAEARLGPITEQHLQEFKQLTSVIFPVKYKVNLGLLFPNYGSIQLVPDRIPSLQDAFFTEALMFGDFTRGGRWGIL